MEGKKDLLTERRRLKEEDKVDIIFQVVALWLVASIPVSLFLASLLKQSSAFYTLNETVKQNGSA